MPRGKRTPTKPSAGADKELHPAEQYAEDVEAGRVVTCKWIRLAVKRHQRDLKTGHKRGISFDRAAAEHAIEFFKFLHHSKGEWAGQEFVLEPWQQFKMWVLFGWRQADGTRRFRTCYTSIARKNGKTTEMSGVGLYLLDADDEPGAEVYSAATKRDQARLSHGEAVRMVKKSPFLQRRIRIFRDNLSVESTNSKFEPLGRDADTMDGLNIHGALVDELHPTPRATSGTSWKRPRARGANRSFTPSPRRVRIASPSAGRSTTTPARCSRGGLRMTPSAPSSTR